MKLRSVTAIAAALVMAVPALVHAQSQKGRGYEINPVNDHVYEAVSEGLHGGAAFWCVASLFAQQKLKASPNAEIYVVRGAGPSVTTDRRSAAQFTLDAAAAGVTPAASGPDLNNLVVGEHMSVNRARTFCS